MYRCRAIATGWLSIATGVVGLLATVSLVMFLVGDFTQRRWLLPFGSLNDSLVGLEAILSGVLALMLYPLHRSQSPGASLLGLTAAWMGAPVAVIGSVLVVSGTTDYLRAGHYTFFGYGLMGVWVLALNHSARQGEVWPARLGRLGLAAGGLMLVGLLGGFGIVRGMDVYDTPPWLVALGGLSFIGWCILYPIWCVWLGRVIFAETSLRR